MDLHRVTHHADCFSLEAGSATNECAYKATIGQGTSKRGQKSDMGGVKNVTVVNPIAWENSVTERLVWKKRKGETPKIGVSPFLSPVPAGYWLRVAGSRRVQWAGPLHLS